MEFIVKRTLESPFFKVSMNSIFSTVWNAARRQIVVVSELTSAHKQSKTSTSTNTTKREFFFVRKTLLAVSVAGLFSLAQGAMAQSYEWLDVWSGQNKDAEFVDTAVVKGTLTAQNIFDLQNEGKTTVKRQVYNVRNSISGEVVAEKIGKTVTDYTGKVTDVIGNVKNEGNLKAKSAAVAHLRLGKNSVTEIEDLSIYLGDYVRNDDSHDNWIDPGDDDGFFRNPSNHFIFEGAQLNVHNLQLVGKTKFPPRYSYGDVFGSGGVTFAGTINASGTVNATNFHGYTKTFENKDMEWGNSKPDDYKYEWFGGTINAKDVILDKSDVREVNADTLKAVSSEVRRANVKTLMIHDHSHSLADFFYHEYNSPLLRSGTYRFNHAYVRIGELTADLMMLGDPNESNSRGPVLLEEGNVKVGRVEGIGIIEMMSDSYDYSEAQEIDLGDIAAFEGSIGFGGAYKRDRKLIVDSVKDKKITWWLWNEQHEDSGKQEVVIRDGSKISNSRLRLYGNATAYLNLMGENNYVVLQEGGNPFNPRVGISPNNEHWWDELQKRGHLFDTSLHLAENQKGTSYAVGGRTRLILDKINYENFDPAKNQIYEDSNAPNGIAKRRMNLHLIGYGDNHYPGFDDSYTLRRESPFFRAQLQTNLDQIFDMKTGVSEGLDLNAQNGDGKVDINHTGQLATGSLVTGIKKEFLENLGIHGAVEFIFNDSVNLATVLEVSKQLAQLPDDMFWNKRPEHFSPSTTFLGKTIEALTVPVANDLLVQQTGGVHFALANDVLDAESNKPLFVGHGDGQDSLVLNDSLGVKNVINTEEVRVNSGKEFALIGTGMTESLIGKNGSAWVAGENSVFTIGSHAVSNAGGRVASVTAENKGKFVVKTGAFEVANVSIKSALMDVFGALKSLDVNLEGKSNLLIGGLLSAKSFTDNVDSEILNEGAMEVEDAMTLLGSEKNLGLAKFNDLSVEGTFENQKKTVTTTEHTDASAKDGIMSAEVHTEQKSQSVVGELFAKQLSVNGLLKNAGRIIADNFDNKGEIVQTEGSVTAKVFAQNGGKTLIQGGNFIADSAQLNGGLFAVNGETDKTVVELNLDGEINADLAIDKGVVIVGKSVEDFNAGLPALKDKAVLKTNVAPIKVGATGKLAVGSGAEQKLASMSGGDAWFGDTSRFEIDTSKMLSLNNGGTAALTGSGSLTVESGAQLHVSNMGWGNYYIAKDFADVALDENGWIKNLTFDKKPFGSVVVEKDEHGNVILQIGSSNIVDKLPNVAIPNIVNSVVSSPALRDVNKTNVIGFLSKAVEDGLVKAEDQTALINAGSNIGAASGSLVTAYQQHGNVIEAVEKHLGFEDVHFDGQKLRPWVKARYWVDVLSELPTKKEIAYTGGKASFDGTNGGFVVGVDLMNPTGLRYGASTAFQRSSVTSKDNIISSSAKNNAVSVAGYVAQKAGNVNMVGTVGFTNVSSDMKQTMPSTMGLGKHELSEDRKILSVGGKVEAHLPTKHGVEVIPHVGVRAVHIFGDKDTSKMGGEKAFSYDNDSAFQVQTPVGVELKTLRTHDHGRRTTSVFDVTLTPTFGDRGASSVVTAAGIDARDVISTTFSDKLTSTIRAGVTTEKNGFAIGADVGVSHGKTTNSDLTANVKARWVF